MNTVKLSKCEQPDFVAAISEDPADKFARTFVAKANTQGLWPHCVGAFDQDLLGAIIVTISKREPRTANLQLLHTFARHRGRNVGTALVDFAFRHAKNHECEYFRVSAEHDAYGFYRKLGFHYWGRQKSGSWLSLFKIEGDRIAEGIYDPNDPNISRKLAATTRGGLVSYEPSWVKEQA